MSAFGFPESIGISLRDLDDGRVSVAVIIDGRVRMNPASFPDRLTAALGLAMVLKDLALELTHAAARASGLDLYGQPLE